MIYLGADHRGFVLKEHLKTHLQAEGVAFEDLGALSLDKDDNYPDFARAVSEAVQKDAETHRGILLCGSGIGIAIAANKFNGIRCGLTLSGWMAEMGRKDDNINVAALAADITDPATAERIVSTFLNTPFSNEPRHQRRLQKMAEIEKTAII